MMELKILDENGIVVAERVYFPKGENNTTSFKLNSRDKGKYSIRLRSDGKERTGKILLK